MDQRLSDGLGVLSLGDWPVEVVELALVDPPERRVRVEVDHERVERLSRSIAREGMLQAPGVRRVGGRYRIVWGEHRIEAARLLGWRRCGLKVVGGDDGGAYVRAAVENIERSDLSPVEESVACVALYEACGQDVDRVCESVNRSRGWVDGRLRMVRWPSDVRDAVHCGALSASAGQELAAVTDDMHRAFLLGHAITSGATARTCQAWRIAWEQTGVVPDVSVVQVGPGRSVPPPVEAELPCYLTGRRLPFSRLVHVWIGADVIDVFNEFCTWYQQEVAKP